MIIKDTNWQQEVDVVVVGFGGAGAPAAITAHDQGAKVLIVEKQPQDSHHNNTDMSGGGFINVNDPEKAVHYIESFYKVDDDLYWTDPEVIRVWAEYVSHNREWIESLGGKVRFFHSGGEQPGPGSECIDMYFYRGWGWGLMKFLKQQVADRNIPVMYNTPAKKLLTNDNGEVLGVRVAQGDEGGGHTVDIRARRAVIMTLGGFEFDEEMKLNYLKVYPTHFYGTPANSGDGHRMVMELGANLWHMNSCSARLVGKFPDFPIAFTMDLGGKNWLLRQISGKETEDVCGYIMVDRDAKRFTSENFKMHTLYYELTVYDSHRRLHPRVPSFWIFDQKRIDSGPLPILMAGPSGPVRLYTWSNDNSTEIAKGWIVKADTAAELARKLELDPDTLEQTVTSYNGYCQQGHDPEFNRKPSDLVPISNPPYYAVKMWPGGPNTQGGPKRNHRAQILNVDGDPIARLYAAGEFGSVYGMLYPSGGGNIAECIAFGRIAGEHAAREEPGR